MSVERGEKVLREIFKAIMIAQFITPPESLLHEKSFSKNAERVRSSSLISLLLGQCRGIHIYVFYIGRTGVVRLRGYEFTNTGILLFCYRRTNLHVRTYVRA